MPKNSKADPRQLVRVAQKEPEPKLPRHRPAGRGRDRRIIAYYLAELGTQFGPAQS